MMIDPASSSPRLSSLFNRSLVSQPFRKETGDGATIFTKSGALYKLESVLGVGGLAVVYMATRFGHKTPVALKVAHKTPDIAVEAAALMTREARILSKLNHPCIVKLVDSGQTVAGELFLATELVRAQTLDLLVRANRGRLPLLRATNIVLQLAEALDHAHQRGIMHRDIKAANVLITALGGTDTVNLFDFGIATDGVDDEHVRDSGSILYASPEQLNCQKVIAQSDIYQLALMFFEMLTGTLPFERSLIETVRYRHGELPIMPDNDSLEFPLHPAIRTLLERALSPDPEVRPCSMNVFAHDLRRTLVKLRISSLRFETECATIQA